jgi:deoxyribodipyrimidine photolyase-related protein
MTTLIPVLGDQLSLGLSSLQGADPADTILLMMEVEEEATYVRHHKKKLAYILSAMRHHANELRLSGWKVEYVEIDQPGNSGSFTGEITRALDRHPIERIIVTHAGEWRVQAEIDLWAERFGVEVEIRPDTRFLTPPAFFEAWATGRSELRMEFFYREMRRHTGLLMNGRSPQGGQWNFDHDNRKPAKGAPAPPRLPHFGPDAITTEVLGLIERLFPDNPGTLDDFSMAVTRHEAEKAADHFFTNGLQFFGDYQDAMLTGEPFLWHSVLSPYLNSGLLDPLDLCRRAEREYHSGRAPLNAVEGFVRQILGWREFVREIYWWAGPEYGRKNFLDAHRPLPGFYWTGETDMHCLAQTIGQTLQHAHAHHIQRLMVTGNFALLIGADPDEVHRWYLEIYADAYEWVELPNTLGMSQFADGGLLASKPYAASGAYIDRMSDYCGTCRYDPKQRTGPGACPFNALYWDFLARNRSRLGSNRRLSMPYRNLDRMESGAREAIKAQAEAFLQSLDESDCGD